MAAVISVLTNQFFLIFLAIALGLLIGKIKIGNFSLGVSGGIFSGILIGYLAYSWASGVQEGEVGYSSATSVLNTGVVSNLFFTFFLMLFLVSTVAYNIMNYIEHHFTEPLTVDQIADALFLNKNHIAHVFKEETGYSLMGYVIALRINRAKLFLSKSDRSITEIAIGCGYDDFAYFSRQFKKATGLTPTAYRKKYANESAGS